MLPPKSAFTTPVLSTGMASEPSSRRMSSGGGGGPVIEYVRGPMRIAMAPVASANPNDAGVGRQQRRGKKIRRWDRPGGFRADGPRGDRPDRGERSGSFESRGAGSGPRPDGVRPAQPWQGPPGEAPGAPGERRKRRRRRRRPRDGAPMQGQLGFAAGNGGASNVPGNGSGPSGGPGDAPVSFFAPAGGGGSGPIVLGPDGQPLRKRRRRRRRGRGGRTGREWRGQGTPGDGSGGGGPPPDSGGAAGGGGSMSDGGDGG
jgi:hypothetical protein